MSSISTTKMSSKGQVVIPENIREKLNLKQGQEFVVVGNRDVVILKSIKSVSMANFDTLIATSRKQARKVGLTKQDVAKAIANARGHH